MPAGQCRQMARFDRSHKPHCYLRAVPAPTASVRVDSPCPDFYDSSPTSRSPPLAGNTIGGRPQEPFMARKYRIAAIGTLTITVLLVAIAGGAHYAARK